MFPMDSMVLTHPVTVEYTLDGKRVRKTLIDIWAARCFYAHKLRQGRNPRFIPEEGTNQ